MPRAFILYSSLTQLSAWHEPVFSKENGPTIYIRAELVDCDHNDVYAVEKLVNPMEGETFLNCVPAEKS